MSFQQYKRFEQDAALNHFQKAVIHDNYGKTSNYAGTVGQGLRTGALHRMPRLSSLKLQSTAKTARACRTCRGGGIIAKRHITNQISYERCPTCGGAKVVYG